MSCRKAPQRARQILMERSHALAGVVTALALVACIACRMAALSQPLTV